MLGAFAVGKTSLVSRFVSSLFSEEYLTTVGVKVDRKELECRGERVHLLLWDLHGEDDFQRLRTTYLRGCSGYLLVADWTRGFTLDVAESLQARAQQVIADVPHVLLINKSDLSEHREIEQGALDALATAGWTIIETSAKTGAGVEQAFLRLTEMMLEPS